MAHFPVFLPRPAPIMLRPQQYPARLPKSAPKNVAKSPKKKLINAQALKTKKTELENQCHDLNEEIRDIDAKWQKVVANRANFKSQSATGGQVKQHVKDRINAYGNELGRLKEKKTMFESKRLKATKKLKLIDEELGRTRACSLLS